MKQNQIETTLESTCLTAMILYTPFGPHWTQKTKERGGEGMKRTSLMGVDVLPPIVCHGVPETVIQASTNVKLDGERERQSIYTGSGPRNWGNSLYVQSALTFALD